VTPLYISGTAIDRNLKFGVQINYEEYYSKMQNYGEKGVAKVP